MPSEDFLKRRLKHAMRDGADIAHDLAESEDIQLPAEYVGRMGLVLFESRMRVAFNESVDWYDFPSNDDERGLH